ncbi:MAG TPA: SpoIID/LytB domain-containing protein, partial [Candidatus Caenarcaniphilales bacterium]
MSNVLLNKQLFRQGWYWWVTTLIWLALVSPAKALELRVAIVEEASQLRVGSSTPAKILDGSGQNLGKLAPLHGFYARPSNQGVVVARHQASQIWIEPTAGGVVYIGNRWYRGRTQLVRTGQTLTAVNHIDLEQYLASVLGKEMYSTWPQEALKAQAVASRTYALHQRQHRANRVFDVGDTTAWQ